MGSSGRLDLGRGVEAPMPSAKPATWGSGEGQPAPARDPRGDFFVGGEKTSGAAAGRPDVVGHLLILHELVADW